MPGEDSFDGQSVNPIKIDYDAPAFREQSVARVHGKMQEKLDSLAGVFQTKQPEQISNFLIRGSDDIARSMLDAGEDEDIYSSADTAIVHAFGMSIWNKPEDTQRIETEIITDLTTQFTNGEIDRERFAKGAYLLQVLLHKYKNGNGRTARATKILIEKADKDPQFTENDTRSILGIGRESVTQTGDTTYQININPDFERMVLGVAYFGLDKGLTQEEIVGRLKLNGSMPEQSLDALSQRLGTPKAQLKEEFIHFLTVKSDLAWCDFGNENATQEV